MIHQVQVPTQYVPFSNGEAVVVCFMWLRRRTGNLIYTLMSFKEKVLWSHYLFISAICKKALIINDDLTWHVTIKL